MTLVKYYNKIILRNKAGDTLAGDVFSSTAGAKDLDELKRNPATIKCPPAGGGGYSFPSVSERNNPKYSIYIQHSKKKEISEIPYREK